MPTQKIKWQFINFIFYLTIPPTLQKRLKTETSTSKIKCVWPELLKQNHSCESWSNIFTIVRRGGRGSKSYDRNYHRGKCLQLWTTPYIESVQTLCYFKYVALWDDNYPGSFVTNPIHGALWQRILFCTTVLYVVFIWLFSALTLRVLTSSQWIQRRIWRKRWITYRPSHNITG